MRSSAALKSTRVGRFRTSALTRRSSTFHFSRLPSSRADAAMVALQAEEESETQRAQSKKGKKKGKKKAGGLAEVSSASPASFEATR